MNYKLFSYKEGENMRMRAAEAVLNIIAQSGTDTVFGYPGSAVAPIYDALFSFDKIRHVLTRGEQSAAHAASGYAKESGKTGVCIATSGPGATNLITGIATAMSDSVPLIAITGQVHSSLIGSDAFQEADITGAANPFCKHNYLIKSADEIQSVLQEAFFIASTGRKGPVLVDIPVNFLTETVDLQKYKKPDIKSYKPNYKGNTLQIKRAADCLKKAKRPLLYIGGGCCGEKASGEIRKFIKNTKIPAVSTLKAVGAVGEGCLNLGMIGTHGKKCANFALSECDTLFVAGARIGDRSLGNAKNLDRDALCVIHVDIDPAEIGKNIKADIPVVGDIYNVMSAINEKNITLNPEKGWISSLEKMLSEEKKEFVKKENFVCPEYAIEVLNSVTDGNCIVSTEVGQNQIWTARNIKINTPRDFITSGGLGTMGFGLPAAIGASFAGSGKDIFAIEGDASLMMSVAELATIAQYNLDIKIILFNNNALGMIKEYQKNHFGARYSEVFPKNPDFIALAKAFGIEGERISDNKDIKDAILRAKSHKGAYFIEMCVDRDENSLLQTAGD